MASNIAFVSTLASIDSLKEHIHNANYNYAMLENVDEITFEKFTIDFTLDAWDKGRLFGEKSELKWIKRNGTYHVVLTTDDDVPDNFTTYGTLEPLKEGPLIDIFLWGEKDTTVEGWYETRIPKVLKYPVDDFERAPSRIKIVIKRYELSEEYEVYRNREWIKGSSTSEIYRYVGLEGE
ncbi:MAG: hypothetical protein K8F52_08825 [Candidatus Scalindua rubra]|uniref:Uncharacterized protein n=1 Tax=Candidatus Scalindua brodae TaxID=237368 RepID=A0A0B0EHD1_9BACT|nr:MAG: hypothetical protein SCABRO_01772 [Candidatus Scalindua brodae]MBZ0108762.1 hypothetical protein [Candidatus Scalindua rubra]TWU30941.1 hypothetical protein S225a_23840 [Candidatus Brocadiaceae bacterium S225]